MPIKTIGIFAGVVITAIIAGVITVSVLRNENTESGAVTTLQPTTPNSQPTTQPPPGVQPTTATETQPPTPFPTGCDQETIEYEKLPPIIKLDENGYQRTPVMSFNGWFWTARTWTADHLLKVADDFIQYGYKDAGYDYIGWDGGPWNGADWMGPLPIPQGATLQRVKDVSRIAFHQSGPYKGAIIHDPLRFPNGVRDLVDKLHAKGFKVGAYMNAGKNFCNGQEPSGFGQHVANVKQFIDFDIDFLKLDACGVTGSYPNSIRCAPPHQNDRECAFLNAWQREFDKYASTKKVLVNNCRIGCMGHKINPKEERCDFDNINNPLSWKSYWNIPGLLNHQSWCSMTYSARSSPDTRSCWSSMINAIYAGLTGTNGLFYDPDTILIGINQIEFTNPNPANYGLTLEEGRTNMALACIMSYVLMIGTDVSTLPESHAAILKNKWAIFINQNIMLESRITRKIRQGRRLSPSNDLDWKAEGTNSVTIWWKPLDNDYNAFVVTNQHASQTRTLQFNITQWLGVANNLITNTLVKRKTSNVGYRVLNVWTEEQTTIQSTISITNLAAHDSYFILTKPLCI